MNSQIEADQIDQTIVSEKHRCNKAERRYEIEKFQHFQWNRPIDWAKASEREMAVKKKKKNKTKKLGKIISSAPTAADTALRGPIADGGKSFLVLLSFRLALIIFRISCFGCFFFVVSSSSFRCVTAREPYFSTSFYGLSVSSFFFPIQFRLSFISTARRPKNRKRKINRTRRKGNVMLFFFWWKKTNKIKGEFVFVFLFFFLEKKNRK